MAGSVPCLQGGTNHGQLVYRKIADRACERMLSAIVVSAGEGRKRLASLIPKTQLAAQWMLISIRPKHFDGKLTHAAAT